MEHGHGLRVWPNGTNYVGEWLEGKRHGKGVFKEIELDTVYDGYFKNDLREGYGIEQKPHPGFYREGLFKGDYQEGEGRLVVTDAVGKPILEYNGNFHNHLFEGFGTLARSDGTYHKGMFVAGVRQGQ